MSVLPEQHVILVTMTSSARNKDFALRSVIMSGRKGFLHIRRWQPAWKRNAIIQEVTSSLSWAVILRKWEKQFLQQQLRQLLRMG